MIKQFTHYGFSYSDSASIGTAYAGFAVTADATNSPTSAAFPDDCFIDSIEFEASGIASGENVTVYLARDSGGLVPITTDQLAGATQAPTLLTGATTSGGYTFTVGKDFHFDPSVANTTRGTLYVFAKVATGAITANIRVNWRS